MSTESNRFVFSFFYKIKPTKCKWKGVDNQSECVNLYRDTCGPLALARLLTPMISVNIRSKPSSSCLEAQPSESGGVMILSTNQFVSVKVILPDLDLCRGGEGGGGGRGEDGNDRHNI